MKMRLYVSMMVLLISASLHAQNRVSVSGVVTDGNNKPLERAAVQILNLGDSAGVAGKVTDAAGKFNVDVVAGNYLLKVSFIGYADFLQSISATKNRNVLDTIRLAESDIVLDSALILGKIIEMVVRGDTVEYNAAAYKVLPSAVVEDLLKKLPGAEIDEQGNIKINGKEVKKILVDKKEFFSTDPKVASKNLPAEMVEKVQVWDKRSDMAELTGFDDGEEETVINLTVKPGMKKGLFGNLSAGAGNNSRYDASASVNYIRNNTQFSVLGGTNNTNNERFSNNAASMYSAPSRGLSFGGRNGIMTSINGGMNFATEMSSKFKIGGNVLYGNTDNTVARNSYSQNYVNSGDQYENNLSSGNNTGKNLGGDLRMEWSPSEATRIIFTPSIRHTENTNRQSGTYLTTGENPADSINWGQSSYYSGSSGLNLNGSLSVSHKFGKKGRTLSLSVSGGMNEQKSDGFNNSRTDYASANRKSVITDQIFNTVNNSYNWRGNISYVEPLGKNNFLQLAYSYRDNTSEQDRKAFKNNGADRYNIVDTASTKLLENDFASQEIKANFQSMRENYNYTVGVAVQPSNSESRTFAPDTAYTTTNSVVNFAPIMQFIYRWDRQTNLRLNYNGSVNQPSTTQLSSARDESNPLNISYGNPDLNPAFVNRFRVQFQKTDRERGSTMILSSNISFTTNDIVRYSLVDSVGKRESTYRNVNGNKNADLRFSLNRPLRNRKFSINTTTNVRYSADNSFVNGEKNTADNLTLGENLGGSFRSDLTDLSLRGNLRYNATNNTLPDRQNTNVFNYGMQATTTFYLPWNFSIESDLNWSANSGYSDGFKQNEWIWNLTVQKQLFAKKNATVRFKVFDLLGQRSNISRNSTAQSMQYTSTNTLGSYFIVHFIYRLQIFKKGEEPDFRRRRYDGGEPSDEERQFRQERPERGERGGSGMRRFNE